MTAGANAPVPDVAPDLSSPVVIAAKELLVRHCRPDKILLFGSRAKGTASQGSDIDLMVLTERPVPRSQQDLVRSFFIDFPVCVDLLFQTLNGFEAGRARKHSFEHTISLSGVQIHDG